ITTPLITSLSGPAAARRDEKTGSRGTLANRSQVPVAGLKPKTACTLLTRIQISLSGPIVIATALPSVPEPSGWTTAVRAEDAWETEEAAGNPNDWTRFESGLYSINNFPHDIHTMPRASTATKPFRYPVAGIESTETVDRSAMFIRVSATVS